VVAKVVKRIICRGQDLDSKTAEECARPELCQSEPVGDLVEDLVCRGRAEGEVDSEDLGQFLLKPVPRRGAGEEVPVLGKRPPHFPRVCGWVAHSDVFEGNPRSVEKARDVVITCDEKLHGVSKREVGGDQLGRDMAMGRDDAAVFDPFV
jgi:hypothetical protein